MKTNECERVRMNLMADADGEASSNHASDHAHVSSCAACQQWLQQFAAVTANLRELGYPGTQQDIWPGVRQSIQTQPQTPALVRSLWPIAMLAFGWRALQLFADLPLPALSLLVPLAAVVVLLWYVSRGLLVIETWAPELYKGGI